MSRIGALEAGGFTIAVLGFGNDLCYPPENRSLKERIIKNGCLISEYPPNTKPLPRHFPARNRIISGLSVGLLVVEAGEKSGTLRTVDYALEQGRDVFAIPGNVTSRLSFGTNNLIKYGVIPVTKSEDILSELNIDLTILTGKDDEKKVEVHLAQEEKLVYDCIGLEPVSVEEITIISKSQFTTVQYILTLLEIKGFVKKLPGQRYIRSF